MSSSQVVRASDRQCRSCNSPRFDPSILWHNEIWGAADEPVWNKVRYRYPTLEKNPQNSPFFYNFIQLSWAKEKEKKEKKYGSHCERLRVSLHGDGVEPLPAEPILFLFNNPRTTKEELFYKLVRADQNNAFLSCSLAVSTGLIRNFLHWSDRIRKRILPFWPTSCTVPFKGTVAWDGFLS